MSDVNSSAQSGRAVSQARRKALSTGKAGLPPSVERVRTGKTSAALPAAVSPAIAPVYAPVSVPSVVTDTAAAQPPRADSGDTDAGPSLAGRLLSIARRRLMSGGKRALAVGTASVTASVQESTDTANPPLTAAEPSGREIARKRRAQLSSAGRGTAPAAPPSRPERPEHKGSIDYSPKVATSFSQSGQQVTGIRIGQGGAMTGGGNGSFMPVSGTQYIAADGGATLAGPAKVGVSRTSGGQNVSGTMLRGNVAITGDEAGDSHTITGNADQRITDDQTARTGGHGAAQFPRRAAPHGSGAFSTPARNAAQDGALEFTSKGLAVSGSAIGRSGRVTGHDSGACRTVTGAQYATPADRQGGCGGLPMAADGARLDPVTGAKITEAQTWRGQRVTGPDVEHNPRMTGDEPGSCAAVTGTQYQGPATQFGWCTPQEAGAAEAQRLPDPVAGAGVTGDVPLRGGPITGTERGEKRDISGTSYYRAPEAPGPVQQADDPVAALNDGFSVVSPQRAAHLRGKAVKSAAEEAVAAGNQITGTFACGEGKVTGNAEFVFTPRRGQPGGARKDVTGEGSMSGAAITGGAWDDHPAVTGTVGGFARDRNPSRRSGEPQAFSGTRVFQRAATQEEPRQIITGASGWTVKSASKVTLSGGAQG